MERIDSKEERYIRAEKRVKEIMGFYTHLFVTVFIVPFIILINLDGSPQFHWFWIFIAAWALGLLIHAINTFGISKISAKQAWERRKIEELAGEEASQNQQNRAQELSYVKAKKRMNEVKGFYVHFFITLFTIPLIIWVNLEYVPGFHFFWYAAGGMALAVFFHWLGVFGLSLFGFGKEWEQRKIQELLEKEHN